MGDRARFDGYIRSEVEELIAECNFTDRERAVFELRAKGASVVETQMALHMSDRTVVRDSRRIRAKIARAQHRRRGSVENADAEKIG